MTPTTTKATVSAAGTMATVSAGLAALLTLWIPAGLAAAASSALVVAVSAALAHYMPASTGAPPIPKASPARKAAAQPEPTPAPEASGVIEIRDGQRVANRIHQRPRFHGKFR